ncbi:MAG: putative 7-carboxy-7-deazaguanine synthase QueE [Lachnospiraceae bacterium]|nr:putative 7-carboxy-7-deazaguanine synthase QueE [Lachnospiraceae bacterium]
MSIPVVETFVSINGESIRAGEPAVFLRFRGCNLNCSYCDTRWANGADAPARQMEVEELAAYADSTGITNVTLTGGEPLLQKEIGRLVERLIDTGHVVEIESNGSLSIGPLAENEKRPFFTLDYKLPDSGMESHMLVDNYRYLCQEDAVKFVAGSRRDLEKAAEIIETYGLCERCKVYLSPVFGRIDPADMVAFLLERKMNRVKLQLQLHKFIWDPEKRGV